MKTRIGKIARLNRSLRLQLNQRLHDGDSGTAILLWLNALPDVQEVLNREFAGRAITPQNLSEWRQGGYLDWVIHQEALELAERLGEDALEFQSENKTAMTDTLALWLAGRYMAATRQVAQTEGEAGWQLLREFCADIVELRRGDQQAERLRLERERWEMEKESKRKKTEEEMWAWARKHQGELCKGYLTEAERIDIIRMKLFGSLPKEGQDVPTPTVLQVMLEKEAMDKAAQEAKNNPCGGCSQAGSSPSKPEEKEGKSNLIQPNPTIVGGVPFLPREEPNVTAQAPRRGEGKGKEERAGEPPSPAGQRPAPPNTTDGHADIPAQASQKIRTEEEAHSTTMAHCGKKEEKEQQPVK